eukprot:jgi/Ulvmu1/1108/UM106_0025.1
MARGSCVLQHHPTCLNRRASRHQAIGCSFAPKSRATVCSRGLCIPWASSASVSSLTELKVVELKEELVKRGIAPGRRKKAELVQALQEALEKLHEPLEEATVDDASQALPVPVTGTSSGVSKHTQLKNSNRFHGEPRKINFIDINSLSDEDQHQMIQSSVHTVPFWWLGTCAATPTGRAPTASLALRAGNEVWLFDCGDDTQRQLHKVCTGSTATSIKHLKLTRLFCTSLAGSRLYGLPGMICTLSAAKGDSRSDTTPVHVYGPEGLAAFLALMLATSDTFVIVPVLVFEFVPGPVPPEDAEPECLNERAKLYRVRVPADAYSPEGFTEVKMANPRWLPAGQWQNRRTGVRRKRARDARQSVRSAERPPPGDPAAPPQPMHELRWTLVGDMEYTVTVTGVAEPQAALSYTAQEPLRGGSLLVEAAEALGVPPGGAYAALKAGEAVKNSAGALVQPSQVVTPDKPGRRLHIVGLYVDPPALQRTLPPVDMVLCEVVTGDEAAAEAAGLVTPRRAAELAAALGAECLVVRACCTLRGGRARACSEAEGLELEARLRTAAPEGVAVLMPQPLQLSLLAKAP